MPINHVQKFLISVHSGIVFFLFVLGGPLFTSHPVVQHVPYEHFGPIWVWIMIFVMSKMYTCVKGQAVYFTVEKLYFLACAVTDLGDRTFELNQTYILCTGLF